MNAFFRFVAIAMALLMLSCSALRGPIGELNRAAREADREIAALEIAYADRLKAATSEQERWRIDAAFAEAFRAHRKLVATWEAAQRIIELAAAIEQSGEPPDLTAAVDMAEALSDLRVALLAWRKARDSALNGGGE